MGVSEPELLDSSCDCWEGSSSTAMRSQAVISSSRNWEYGVLCSAKSQLAPESIVLLIATYRVSIVDLRDRLQVS